MTAKDKAIELFDKISWAMVPGGQSVRTAGIIERAKIVALITVDEICDLVNQILKAFDSESDGYWETVKEEINKL